MVGLHQHMDYGLAPTLFSMPRTRAGESRAEAEALAALEIVGYGGDPLESAGNLAFGHQRLVEIARALVTRPALLLLDDPRVLGTYLGSKHRAAGPSTPASAVAPA